MMTMMLMILVQVQRLVDKAEDVKKEHVRFCKTAPHHALCPPALSPAEMLVKKYHDSRGTFSTRSSLNIIASLRVPLSPLFSVRVRSQQECAHLYAHIIKVCTCTHTSGMYAHAGNAHTRTRTSGVFTHLTATLGVPISPYISVMVVMHHDCHGFKP